MASRLIQYSRRYKADLASVARNARLWPMVHGGVRPCSKSALCRETFLLLCSNTDVPLISSCLCLLLCNKNLTAVHVADQCQYSFMCRRTLRTPIAGFVQTYHNLRGTRVFIKLDSFWGNYVADPHAASQSAKSMVQSTTPLHM